MNPKKWRPSDPEPAEVIFETLRRLAPSVSFGVDWAPDPNYLWGGDGPDPATEDYVAHDVAVVATLVAEGMVVQGFSYLGGVYEKRGEKDPDIYGYLPQMLAESAVDLLEGKGGERHLSKQMVSELESAVKYLEKVLKLRYDRQRSGRGGG